MFSTAFAPETVSIAIPNFKANFTANYLGTNTSCFGVYNSKYPGLCRYCKTEQLVTSFVICHAMESDVAYQTMELETCSTMADIPRVVEGLVLTYTYV